MPDTASFQLPQEFLIVGAAVQIGLLSEIKTNPCTLEELASRTQADQRALWTVVEALVALGYLAYDGQKIRLTGEADNIFYNPGHQEYIGFTFMHTYNLINRWTRLPEVLQSGKPASRQNIPKCTEHFITAMSKYARQSAPQIVDFCLKELPANPRVLDVGGGPLTMAIAFAGRGAKVTVLDLPEVVDMMRPQLTAGLPVELVEGDFTRGLPPGPYDLVYLGNICHIYGAQENKKLFKDTANILAPAGQIVINDMLRGTGVGPALFGINMLINTDNGGAWTYEEYKTWLATAGFSAAPWVEVGGRQLIKAARA